MLSNDLPTALSPVYVTSKPNESIRLYEGLLKITQEITLEQEDGSKETKELIECGNGFVEFTWFPNPRIKFKFKNYNNEHHPTMVLDHRSDNVVLTLCELNTSVPVSISRFYRGDTTNEVEGSLQATIDYGAKDNLDCVIFHVANFHECQGFYPTVVELEKNQPKISCSRFYLEVEGWKLTLDRLETTKNNAELLDAEGGFAITHIGRLERSDGETFSGITARDFLEIFRHFLSFSRGLGVPIILLVGYDTDGNQIWNYWQSSGGDSWRRVESWFPATEPKCLAEIFPGFVSWWRIPPDTQKISTPSFVADCFKTPSQTPIESLVELAKNNKWIDGPHALTEIRNSLSHPKNRQRVLDASDSAKWDALDLGLWYLELVLLYIFGYQGRYTNRLIKNQRDGDTEPVPWQPK
jgi:hypothetical protein